MHTTEDLAALLSQHTHSEQIYHHPDVASFCYTEGAKAFFQHAGAGAAWLRDLLATNARVRDGVMAAPYPCKVLMIVTDSRSRADAGQSLGSGQRSALITVSEELEWDYMCDDEHAGLGVPSSVFFGVEVEETDCPVGAWTFYLAGIDGRKGMILALPSEVA